MAGDNSGFSKKLVSNKKLMYGIIAGLLIVGIFVIYGIRMLTESKKTLQAVMEQKEKADVLVPVRVYKTSRNNYIDTLTALGNVEGGSQIELMFRKEGVIKEFNYKEGDFVEKDGVIAMLDAREDELKLEQAKLEYDQHKKLFEAGVIIQTKLDQARVTFRQAGEEYRKNLLEAPINGMIATVEHKTGEFVNSSKPILTMFDIKRMVIKIGVTESDINKLYKGQPARVTFDGLAGMVFDGKITNINPSIDEILRMMVAEISVDNPEKLILPGMFARCSVIVYKEDHALLVPSTAVRKSADGHQVFVAGEKDMVVKRAVEVNHIARDYTVIKTGLNENERVILDKIDSLKEATAVKIVKTEEYESPETIQPGIQ